MKRVSILFYTLFISAIAQAQEAAADTTATAENTGLVEGVKTSMLAVFALTCLFFVVRVFRNKPSA